MRKMGIDYGDVRIGISLSDPTLTIATSFDTYKCRGTDIDIDYLTKIAIENNVDEFILGLPINMDGTEGPRSIKTREFGQKLENISGLKVILIDERLSSVSANKLLIEAGTRREKRKEFIDRISASIILQSYLDRIKK